MANAPGETPRTVRSGNGNAKSTAAGGVMSSGDKTKQSTLMGFFGKPRPGMASSTKKSSAVGSSPAQSSLPPSSPPLAASSQVTRAEASSPVKPPVRAPSPLKPSREVNIERELTPPPSSSSAIKAKPDKKVKEDRVEVEEEKETDEQTMDIDASPINPVSSHVQILVSPQSRRAKRKVLYVESDSEASSTESVKPKATSKGRKGRKSLKAESDSDDYVFDEQEDIAFSAALDEFEAEPASPSPSLVSEPDSPQPRSKKTKAKPKARASSPSSRPPPRPLGGDGGGSSRNSNSFITAAERRKEQAAQARKDNEDCFDFIKPENIRDKDGNRPDDPDYDPRTIHVPAKAFDSLSPFEKQFWTIKKDHYDTVLFFQKGKFFELYEEDARIGHRDFDLKLTERVKMCMVGVPEQSFEYWAAKFLAAGYKVGKVEQAETAIGKEMRTKGGAQDKIVRRELAQVFTNGTIVDPTYLTTDEANHCVAIKEHVSDENGKTSFGICILDASTGEFNLSAFEDDVVRTRLETTFRKIRPKELVHCKGNLSVETQRLLRTILPSSTLWQSFRDGREFYSAKDTLDRLPDFFDAEEGSDPVLPEAISSMVDTPVAIEALGGMLYYLKSLNLDKDLVSQRNFNIYDPIREGKSLVLDGVTLGHMEVLVNNEGGTEGTLLSLLQLCHTPSGKRLFKTWLANPLLDPKAINERLDAVEDLLRNASFTGEFRKAVKKLPDLERLLSRLHAGSIKESAFLSVVEGFETIERTIDDLLSRTEFFDTTTVSGLLRTAPDLRQLIKRTRSLYVVNRGEKTLEILPTDGADEDTDVAKAEVDRIVAELDAILAKYKKQLKCDLSYWHSAQGGKEIYQLQVPEGTRVPDDWIKQGGTKKATRYLNRETSKLIRAYQEAKETETAAKKNFFRHLLAEFDKDRAEWLKAVRVIAELDCLVSLALASANLDEPKCRPEFVETEQSFIEFEELRHPSMCLRLGGGFIANDVKLGSAPGEDTPRTILLTGPNMAGKSTLLRMTAAGIIMAQVGCYVPASKARLSPIDKIQTRMGAYDNMFASASTFKVELDECSKILREAGPKSFVILDELGRGTSTYDGMAIAGAVLHHLATHTLPLAFFATHYGSLTDDYAYHPNIRNMHMKTHVDDDQRQVVFLYKLIPGVAESSHGTHVATMAGVPSDVVTRADQVSAEFFDAFKLKLAGRRQSTLPLVAHADFAWLLKVALGKNVVSEEQEWQTCAQASLTAQLDVVRRAIGNYEVS